MYCNCKYSYYAKYNSTDSKCFKHNNLNMYHNDSAINRNWWWNICVVRTRHHIRKYHGSANSKLTRNI